MREGADGCGHRADKPREEGHNLVLSTRSLPSDKFSKFLAWSVFLLLNIFAEEESRESRAQTPEFCACFAMGRREQSKIREKCPSPPPLVLTMVLPLLWPQNLPPPPVLTLTLTALVLLLLRLPPNLQQPRELGRLVLRPKFVYWGQNHCFVPPTVLINKY